jgi:hypothetical protein
MEWRQQLVGRLENDENGGKEDKMVSDGIRRPMEHDWLQPNAAVRARVSRPSPLSSTLLVQASLQPLCQ